MKISVAIQMDSIEGINTKTDTTYLLALEAKKRNYTIYHYLPESLSLVDGKLVSEDLLFINKKNNSDCI